MLCAQLSHAIGESASDWTAARAAASIRAALLRRDLPDDVPVFTRDDVADALDPLAGWCAPSLRTTLPPDTHAVILAADDEGHLLRIAEALSEAGHPFRLINEPDPPYLGQAMALGILPTRDRAALRPVTGSLRLLR